jgi:dTDP-4-dehydrorhamnose 3,5-epimerase-like enzyme
MIITKAKIPGCYEINISKFYDKRGSFIKTVFAGYFL